MPSSQSPLLTPSRHRLRQFSARSRALHMVAPDVVDPDTLGVAVEALGFKAPPPEVLASMIGVSGLSAGAYRYWDKVIVPQKRAEVAASKRKGEIKEYLEDIRG